MTSFRSPRRHVHRNPTIPRYVNAPIPPRQQGRPIPKVSTPRECLSCSKQFPSESVANRVCEDCKRLEEWRLGGDF